MIEGDLALLVCSNVNNSIMTGFFEWFGPEGTSLGLSILQPFFVLVFDNVQRNESGVYTCVLSIGGLSLSANTTLCVQCK